MVVGNTPLVKVDGIYAKLECVNPTGSIKDRIAKYIIEENEKQGILKPGMHIIEASSGNTGIALAYFAREKGYKVTVVMPENMSKERMQILQDLGANLILCHKEGSFKEAARIRDDYANSLRYFNPDQFSNPLNVECHEITTGVEIIEQFPEIERKYRTGFKTDEVPRIDYFVAGIGTGGSLIGVAKALKKVYPNVKIIGVEPAESAFITKGESCEHFIQGIGDGFIPEIASGDNSGLSELIDGIEVIPQREALNAAKYLNHVHNLCVGISSGANFLAAQNLRENGNNVVTLFPDGFFKYQSFGLLHSCGGCPYERQRVNVLK